MDFKARLFNCSERFNTVLKQGQLMQSEIKCLLQFYLANEMVIGSNLLGLVTLPLV